MAQSIRLHALRCFALLSAFTIILPPLVKAAVPVRPTAVLTQHNDNYRSGDNLTETTLTITNVNTTTFGLLYSRPADDEIYAQPLIMTNVTIPGVGPRNLLIIATVNDTVYAYDADDPTVVAPYWTNTFVQPPNIVPPSNPDETAIGACPGELPNFDNNFGIVGTPVIDPVSGTIYVVARTKEISAGVTNFVQRLHALDPTTGLDRTNSAVVITATYPGTGDGSDGTNITFDPLRHNQRAALLLVKGTVYICWASHCDNGPYHGWVMGYNAATLQQTTLFVNTPNGSDGGFWMSGQGPCADAQGNVYLSSGNGSVDASDYGESFLKLTKNKHGTMDVASYFIPTNWSALDEGDLDLGSAGLLLIPNTTLAISGGKSSMLYLVDRDHMNNRSRSINPDPRVLQSWTLGGGEIHGSPVWWRSANGSFMYIWAANLDYLRQYKFAGGRFTQIEQSATFGGFGSPGGILSVSANGLKRGTGILWAVVNQSDAISVESHGTLHAYNAQNVSDELWNSDMLPGDSLGALAKFVPPTIANGKVYMATFDSGVRVYGLH